MRAMCVCFTSGLLLLGCSDPSGVCGGDDAPASCGQPCKVDVDCGFGLYCADGTCTADCATGGGQCAAGERCDGNGQCVTITDPDPCKAATPPLGCGETCASDFDCRPGFYCGSDGQCTADCVPNGDQCDTGMHCGSDGRCAKNPGGLNCPDVTISLSPVVPRVMILIDQSGSMDESFGQVNGNNVDRWEAVRYGLTHSKDGAVTKLQATVRFAATLYHSKNGNQGGTCPILTKSGTGQPKLNNRKAIDDLLADNDPVADTPTAESIDATITEMKSWTSAGPDAKPSPRILVLATDGNPDNCQDPDAHDATSQIMSETATQNGYKAGIETHVLSVGSDVSEAHLKRMANAGVGKPLDPPDAPFYRGNNPAELVKAFNDIIRGVRTCVFTLDQAVQAQYAESGTVTLNGTTLTWNVDWVLKDDTTIELKGQACTTFIDEDTVNLVATFPCGAVIK